MVELDAAQVLSIPRRLKSQEVVRHGFMSNFLFQNIGNVFGAPGIVKEIVGKLTPAHEDPKKRDQENLRHISEVPVNEDGEIDIPEEIIIGKAQGLFGKKYYEEMNEGFEPQLSHIAESSGFTAVEQSVKKLADKVKEKIRQGVVAPVAEAYEEPYGAAGGKRD